MVARYRLAVAGNLRLALEEGGQVIIGDGQVQKARAADQVIPVIEVGGTGCVVGGQRGGEIDNSVSSRALAFPAETQIPSA